MTINIERQVLKYILNNKDEELALFTPLSFFTKKLNKDLFFIIQEYLREFKTFPSKNKIVSYAETKFSSDDSNRLKMFLDVLLEEEDDLTKKEAEEFIKKGMILKEIDDNIEKLVESAKDKDISKFNEILNNLSEKVSITNKSPVSVENKSFELDNIVMIEPFLASMRDNGLFFTGVSVIGSGSGFGKSIFVINQLMYNYEQGENVCLLNLELGYNETIARMYSCATNTPFYKVFVEPEEGIEEKVNEWRKTYFNRDNKFYMDDQPYNIYEVENVIRTYAKKGVKIFAIDYLNLVELPSYKDEWKTLATFIKKLHRLTRELGIVIITPTQVNVQDIKEKNNTISITTRGSRELEFSASVLLMLWRNKEEYEQNTMRIFTIKSRNSKGNTFVVETDFSNMKFIDTGIVF